MAKNRTEIDDDEVASLSGITINEATGDFSPEWLSYSFMDSVKQMITRLSEVWSQSIANEKNYLSGTDIISNTIAPALYEISTAIGTTSQVGTVTASILRVRKGEGTEFEIMDKLPKGSKVKVLKDGDEWVQVELEDGKVGYVSKQYLNVEKEKLIISDGKEIDGKVTTKGGRLNIRSKPNGEIVGKFENGEKIKIVGQVKVSDNEIWYKVITENGEEAYVSKDYVDVKDTSKIPVIKDTKPTHVETPVSPTSAASTTSASTDKSQIQYTTKIPADVKQAGYTATCYERDGWHFSASRTGSKVGTGTGQKLVHDTWNSQGSQYADGGLAVIDDNGVKRYLVATSEKVGKVGDRLTVHFGSGESIDVLVADQKSTKDKNAVAYGHQYGGSVNILEFEVNTQDFRDKKNPGTEKWPLPWDNSSGITSIDNHGSAKSDFEGQTAVKV